MMPRRWTRGLMMAGLALAAGAVLAARAAAQTAEPPAATGSPLHPAIALRDAAGENVLASGAPVSTLATCGECHDTAYIQEHNSHLAVGPNTTGADWDPLLYRTLATASEARPDLDAASWQTLLGQRVPGDASTESNCFLCHLAQPDNAARVRVLGSGEAAWANTATLAATGLVKASAAGWQWNEAAFEADGLAAAATLGLQDPADANCAQCHAAAHSPAAAPVALTGCGLDANLTAATGLVYSSQSLADSGLNLAGKAGLTRAWDVHAERGLGCTDCHYAPNNPVHARANADEAVEHLVFDPRRLEVGEYVQRPSHDFSAGAQCTDCHAAEAAHDWLPYAAQHMQALACETCHVPTSYAPALQTVDWTVLTAADEPRTVCRGVEGNSGTSNDLVTGYRPAILARGEGETLAPYNLVTAWYWEYDGADGQAQSVRLQDLHAAYFDADGVYGPEIVAAFDTDGDGQVSATELVVDSPVKAQAVSARLAALGLAAPRIAGQVRPYALTHSVTSGEWATGDCAACHTGDSRLAAPMMLAAVMPGGALPALSDNGEVLWRGTLADSAGALLYTPDASQAGRYVLGHDRAAWADWLGALAFLGVLGGVSVHGGLRLRAALKARHTAAAVRREYMYTVYERFWHWLQTFTIVLLLATGLIIHRPDLFALFSFRHVVVVHNVLAAILVINAALALFYHLASGEIRQFLPRPYGFFDQAITQAKFYLRGIFRGEAHPFEKTPARKLNPLQQITYVGILNVLLPLQVVTGALMWGAQQWPAAAARVGGLAVLGPVHSLAAWLFGAFIVAHVYLTTTGHTPLAGINAMMNGWEDVDLAEHVPSQEMSKHDDPVTNPAAAGLPSAAAAEGPAV